MNTQQKIIHCNERIHQARRWADYYVKRGCTRSAAVSLIEVRKLTAEREQLKKSAATPAEEAQA